MFVLFGRPSPPPPNGTASARDHVTAHAHCQVLKSHTCFPTAEAVQNCSGCMNASCVRRTIETCAATSDESGSLNSVFRSKS